VRHLPLQDLAAELQNLEDKWWAKWISLQLWQDAPRRSLKTGEESSGFARVCIFRTFSGTTMCLNNGIDVKGAVMCNASTISKCMVSMMNFRGSTIANSMA